MGLPEKVTYEPVVDKAERAGPGRYGNFLQGLLAELAEKVAAREALFPVTAEQGHEPSENLWNTKDQEDPNLANPSTAPLPGELAHMAK